MRWSVYVRISEDRTGEEWGVERQLRDIHQAISGRDSNPEVTEFIENDVSAYKKRPRPRFEEMMRRVEAGDFDVICAKHMDRLLRRLLELEETLERCEATGTYIITTHDGVDTSTEGGRLVARILASVAQGEVERKKARQVSAFKQAAEQGRWTGGRRPFGYEFDGSERLSEAQLVRLAYASVLSGASLHSIATDWNEKGVKTTVGNKWTGTTVRQMLVKPRYAGLRTYHGEIIGEGKWAALVDEDLWTAATAVLRAPGRRVSDNARKHLLSGLLICGKCGKRLNSGANPHPIYRCKHCGGVSRAMEPIDRLVEKLIKAFLASDDAKELMIDRSREDLAALRLEERTLLGRLDELAVERADGLLTARQLKVATDKITPRLEEIQKKITHPGRKSTLEKLVSGAERWDDLGLDRRRAVIAEIAEFTLLPAGRGAVFKPEHLAYRWLVEEE